MIRNADENDIRQIAAFEREKFGNNGYSEQFIRDKFRKLPAGLMIAENESKITGFVLCEVLEKDQMSSDFKIMRLKKPINGKWMHIIAFTTVTNYQDFEHDSGLLLAAEKSAISKGANTARVPLPKEHAFGEAYGFWERNGYRNGGVVMWKSPLGDVECYFYEKNLE